MTNITEEELRELYVSDSSESSSKILKSTRPAMIFCKELDSLEDWPSERESKKV